MSRKRFGLGTRVSLSGITGDAIPTLQIRGANQTAPVVNVDSTSFPQDATVFFQVRVNGTRLIECSGNQTMFLGPFAVNGNSEWLQSTGRFIATNSTSGQGPTIPQINVYATGSHTALAYRLHHGVTGDFTTQNPTGTFQWGINSANGGLHARFATTATSGTATRGTVALTAGTVTVTNTYVATGDRVIISFVTGSGTLSSQYECTAIVNLTSFTITGKLATNLINVADNSTVYWEIIRPA